MTCLSTIWKRPVSLAAGWTGRAAGEQNRRAGSCRGALCAVQASGEEGGFGDSESERFFSMAEKAFPNEAKVLFERADTYIRGRRNLGAARELLKRYLAAELSPEAVKLLRQASRS